MADSLFLTGESLKQDIERRMTPRSALVDDFLYENTSTMLFGDAGLGKTTLIAQIIAETSCGNKVFSRFKTKRPLVSAYMSFERSLQEIEERLLLMSKVISMNFENIHMTDKTIGINLLDSAHTEAVVKRLKEIHPTPDIVWFDPIYASVRGGLSMDEKASIFTRVCTTIQRDIGCSIFLSHHTLKHTSDLVEGKRVKKDEIYYGSMWLKAHVTGSFLVESSKDGTTWTKKKDNYSSLISSFKLVYDPSTNLSHFLEEGPFSKTELFRNYFNACFAQKKRFTIRSIQEFVNITDRYAREILALPSVKTIVYKDSTKPFEYEPIEVLNKGYELAE